MSSLTLGVAFFLGRAGGGGYTRTAVTIIKIPSTDLEQLVVHFLLFFEFGKIIFFLDFYVSTYFRYNLSSTGFKRFS